MHDTWRAGGNRTRERRGQKQIKPLRVLGREGHAFKHGALNINEIELVAPTGFEPVFQP